MVHASHPYVAVGNTVLFRIRTLVFAHCPFQILSIFFSLDVAIASLLLISGVVFPSACILAPRYSKLSTLSISSPSILTTASSLHLSVSMILVFLTFRYSPFCSLCSLTDFMRCSSPLGVVLRSAVSSAYLRSLRFPPYLWQIPCDSLVI